jgi:hypothetical protein
VEFYDINVFVEKVVCGVYASGLSDQLRFGVLFLFVFVLRSGRKALSVEFASGLAEVQMPEFLARRIVATEHDEKRDEKDHTNANLHNVTVGRIG